MSVNPFGVLDISIVTELLVGTIKNYWPGAPLWSTLPAAAFFTPNMSGLTPEAARLLDGSQLTISLLHIEPNKSQRNFVYPLTSTSPGSSPRAQPIPALPLGLDLYYFVSAYSAGSYQQEQQAMSIVLNCFHQNPILRTNVMFPGSPAVQTQEEFTLTMEIESVDTMSRLWQAVTSAFRLSVMYKVSVVFLTPPAPPSLAKPVARYGLAVEPTSFPFASGGQVFGTTSTTVFTTPSSPPQSVAINYSPATVVPGQRFFINGAALNQGTDYTGPPPNPGTSYRVYLLQPPDYDPLQEIEVTAPWKTKDVDPANPIQTSSRLVLDLPNSVGALPTNTPPPGIYLLSVGSNLSADAETNRTNATPFSVAARVDAANPLLPEASGEYTVNGLGFVAGNTEVLLDSIPLAYVAASPASGEFSITSNTVVTFKAPTNLGNGLYTVRIRVNGVESPPGLWIKVQV